MYQQVIASSAYVKASDFELEIVKCFNWTFDQNVRF